jgi:hypothetical protein
VSRRTALSYDISVWVPDGQLLAGIAADNLYFEMRMDAIDERENLARKPIDPRIDKFLNLLTRRFPERLEGSIYAAGPLIDEVDGDFIYFSLAIDAISRALPVIHQIAVDLELQYFDPQLALP